MAKDSVVKIDGEILGKVEEFISENKYQYSSLKQVINLAVLEFLKSKSLGKLKRGKE
jgi:hypothetical protein